MCKGLMGKKLGMTGLFLPDGQYVPVTVIEAGPCVVTQIKTAETDGYNALQLGFGKKTYCRNFSCTAHYLIRQTMLVDLPPRCLLKCSQWSPFTHVRWLSPRL